MKRQRMIVSIGWVVLTVMVGLYSVSVLTGPIHYWNLIPPFQLEFELKGRPWCMDHRIPVPMYDGHGVYELAHADLDGVHASIESTWRCPICGTKSRQRDEFWQWIHGRNERGGPLIAITKDPSKLSHDDVIDTEQDIAKAERALKTGRYDHEAMPTATLKTVIHNMKVLAGTCGSTTYEAYARHALGDKFESMKQR